MRWRWAILGLAAALLALAWGFPGAPGDADVHRRLLAHPEMAPYNRSNSTIVRIAPESLPKLAAEQPAVYGGLPDSPLLYRFDLLGANGSVVVLYDAGSDRILRVFNLLEGRLG